MQRVGRGQGGAGLGESQLCSDQARVISAFWAGPWGPPRCALVHVHPKAPPSPQWAPAGAEPQWHCVGLSNTCQRQSSHSWVPPRPCRVPGIPTWSPHRVQASQTVRRAAESGALSTPGPGRACPESAAAQLPRQRFGPEASVPACVTGGPDVPPWTPRWRTGEPGLGSELTAQAARTPTVQMGKRRPPVGARLS